MTAQGYRRNQMYEIVAPNGRRHTPPEGRCWSMIRPEFEKLVEAKRIYWGKDGNAQPSDVLPVFSSMLSESFPAL